MSGVCLDALNPTGKPGRVSLLHLGVDAYRAEIRNDPQYTNYINKLKAEHTHYALVGPSTSNLSQALQSLKYKPDVVIIGNEPDSDGDSSWTMSYVEYAAFYNRTAEIVKTIDPTIRLCAAGILGPTTEYLEQCWSYMVPTPDLVNKHYPNNQQEIENFYTKFNKPVIVGEWCWKTATQQEMIEWVDMLDLVSYEHFWFCWSDGMIPNMGLKSKTNHNTVAYYRYKKAIGA